MKQSGAFNLSWVLPSPNLDQEGRNDRTQETQDPDVPPSADPFLLSDVHGFAPIQKRQGHDSRVGLPGRARHRGINLFENDGVNSVFYKIFLVKTRNRHRPGR
ncbi:hypothetical protein [Sulfidibacter corallicola]|uniref:Uncharacterized protein n=1 Tax=Sulfidibacter corallicola TaxID=2818388 RepID=A0A8A4TE91_SULCO|nr:hypothetical protein [Sulfidibacter corallicola]QTD48419.1 hypothetical protein J3U87_22800 [Sulfidibacter corallicola]